jgi:prevent-host-death family protein
MRAISITELNQQTSRVVRAVQEGEQVEISMHGRVVARLVPAMDQATWLERKKSEGRITPPSAPDAPLPDLVAVKSGLSLDQLIDESKGDH